MTPEPRQLLSSLLFGHFGKFALRSLFLRNEKKTVTDGPDEKELKKKEKQRLEKEKKELKEKQEREKKEQKEREKREHEMKKKFKVSAGGGEGEGETCLDSFLSESVAA